MTDKQKEFANDTVAYLKKHGGNYAAWIHVANENPEKQYIEQDALYVFAILANKGVLQKHDGVRYNRETVLLTDKGWEYETYDKLIADENAEKQLTQEQITSATEANKSVKRTNRFVINNAKRQNRLTTASIVVAGASALFALGSIIVSLFVAANDKTSSEVQLLRLQLQKLSQIQERMSQSQKEIDSSLKTFLERSHSESNDLPDNHQ